MHFSLHNLTTDDWPHIWIQTNISLIDSFHIVFSALLEVHQEDLEQEHIFDALFTLLNLRGTLPSIPQHHSSTCLSSQTIATHTTSQTDYPPSSTKTIGARSKIRSFRNLTLPSFIWRRGKDNDEESAASIESKTA